ncbi:carbohydrate kinase family protein [Dermabacter vaginalis]|uniref:Carbohydrate kinase n=1 Tax=Dermabacter vaginalis TaxID=1630135 RepID=A0ABX6A642_9MICO|nr:carbohydrate kinase [Dermabacter vaginalis]QEU12329.1 carbohydrate kinase [Dermabacter vaginalis]
MSTYLTIGEALTDIVIRTDAPRAEFPGGSPMNVAVALGRLGHTSHLLTHIGDDERGHAIERHVKASSVSLTPGSVRPGAATSTAAATIGEGGAATYDFDITWDPDPEGVPTQVEAVHTSSIAATLEPGADTLRRVVSSLREHALISYDPNARPSLMGDPSIVREPIEENIALADIVKASDEDLEWLYETSDIEQAAESWLRRGVRLAVITRGEQGATAFTAKGRVDIPGVRVEVTDTVGAGDTFSAGILDALSRKGLLGAEGREKIDQLKASEIKEILAHAALLASVTVSRAGANPPWTREIADRCTL